jgi:hypothetical protein
MSRRDCGRMACSRSLALMDIPSHQQNGPKFAERALQPQSTTRRAPPSQGRPDAPRQQPLGTPLYPDGVSDGSADLGQAGVPKWLAVRCFT